MNRDDIIRMAREADLNVHDPAIDLLQRFADHVAKHTLANIDPSSFMTWQEGYEAGKQAERERLAKVFDERDKDIGWYDPGEPAEIIRGQA